MKNLTMEPTDPLTLEHLREGVKLRMCFEINGLAEDEHGDLAPAGLAVTLGETRDHVDYQELVQNIDIAGVLKLVCLNDIVRPEDVKIITPKEYAEKYGDGGEEPEQMILKEAQ